MTPWYLARTMPWPSTTKTHGIERGPHGGAADPPGGCGIGQGRAVEAAVEQRRVGDDGVAIRLEVDERDVTPAIEQVAGHDDRPAADLARRGTWSSRSTSTNGWPAASASVVDVCDSRRSGAGSVVTARALPPTSARVGVWAVGAARRSARSSRGRRRSAATQPDSVAPPLVAGHGDPPGTRRRDRQRGHVGHRVDPRWLDGYGFDRAADRRAERVLELDRRMERRVVQRAFPRARASG